MERRKVENTVGALPESVRTIYPLAESSRRTAPTLIKVGFANKRGGIYTNVVSYSLPAPSRKCSAATAVSARLSTCTPNTTGRFVPNVKDGAGLNATLYELSGGNVCPG